MLIDDTACLPLWRYRYRVQLSYCAGIGFPAVLDTNKAHHPIPGAISGLSHWPVTYEIPYQIVEAALHVILKIYYIPTGQSPTTTQVYL